MAATPAQWREALASAQQHITLAQDLVAAVEAGKGAPVGLPSGDERFQFDLTAAQKTQTNKDLIDQVNSAIEALRDAKLL